MITSLTDFPKIHCPFIRKNFDVDKNDWKEHGRKLKMRQPKLYLVVDKINPGYEWVFDDPDTFAVEKLDGSNVKILTEEGRLILIQNRKNIIDPLQIIKGTTHFVEGILRSSSLGYINENGEQGGEIIGPKIQ